MQSTNPIFWGFLQSNIIALFAMLPTLLNVKPDTFFYSDSVTACLRFLTKLPSTNILKNKFTMHFLAVASH